VIRSHRGVTSKFKLHLLWQARSQESPTCRLLKTLFLGCAVAPLCRGADRAVAPLLRGADRTTLGFPAPRFTSLEA